MDIKSKVKENISDLKKTAYILSLLDAYSSLSIVSEEYKFYILSVPEFNFQNNVINIL